MRQAVLFLLALAIGLAFWSRGEPLRTMRKTVHRLQMDPDSHCTGTAVGKHTILTATHCLSQQRIEVDGKTAIIAKYENDDNDHSLLFLRGVEFTSYAKVAENPQMGDEFWFVGHPVKFEWMFRRGTVSGRYLISGEELNDMDGKDGEGELPRSSILSYELDANAFFGDSGACMFDRWGRCIGVLSIIERQRHMGNIFPTTISFPLEFSKEALQRARNF